MAIVFPIEVTTNAERLAYMEEVHVNWVKVHNVFGRWFRYRNNKWFILKGFVDTGAGWKGSDCYHGEVLKTYTEIAAPENVIIGYDQRVTLPQGKAIDEYTITRRYNTQADADAVLVSIGSPQGHVVVSPGVSLAEYNSLPARYKNGFAYSPKLDAAQWKDAKRRLKRNFNDFTPELLMWRIAIGKANTYNPDPSDATGGF